MVVAKRTHSEPDSWIGLLNGLFEWVTGSSRQIPASDHISRMSQERSMAGSRRLESSDAADAVPFLAIPLSDLIQEQTLVVEGGASIHA